MKTININEDTVITFGRPFGTITVFQKKPWEESFNGQEAKIVLLATDMRKLKNEI